MDLFEDEGGNAPEFTVSEISGAVKRTIEGAFGRVRIRGEVGRVSRPRSGHVYLDLKDDRSVIAAIMWKGVAARQETPVEEGMEVVASGRLTTFPGQSRYQLVIEEIRPAGRGALMAMLEKRRAALQAEGLFDAARKRPLPFLPEVIGVVTSPSGAVIRDILHRLRDRFPRRVLIWPVAVQGAGCAPEVARAIAGFNALTPGGALPRPDLLIVARGGGSVEDLWGFNDEAVVRAAVASDIPLISAVGHETDTTLLDHAADRRAPTPSAAAEMAVPVRRDLAAALDEQRARLRRASDQHIALRRQRLSDLARILPRPERLLEAPRQRLDQAAGRLPAALVRTVQLRRVAVSDCSGALRPGLLRARLAEERRHLAFRQERLEPALRRSVAGHRDALNRLGGRLAAQPFRERMARRRERLDDLGRRLSGSYRDLLLGQRRKLEALERLRASLGYECTIERGFAVVRDGEGRLVTAKARAGAAEWLEIQFGDGRLGVRPVDGPAAPKDGATPAPRETSGKRPRTRRGPPEQGSLF
ncbi:MAG: exodeoxyribonuclease VII large subunit [Actinomycetota bacterium]|jgi:exodeoxyribonuclease VII large subunit